MKSYGHTACWKHIIILIVLLANKSYQNNSSKSCPLILPSPSPWTNLTFSSNWKSGTTMNARKYHKCTYLTPISPKQKRWQKLLQSMGRKELFMLKCSMIEHQAKPPLRTSIQIDFFRKASQRLRCFLRMYQLKKWQVREFSRNMDPPCMERPKYRFVKIAVQGKGSDFDQGKICKMY